MSDESAESNDDNNELAVETQDEKNQTTDNATEEMGIQEYFTTQVATTPAFPDEDWIPDAKWEDNEYDKQTYLKFSLTGDPKDVRTKFNYEDYEGCDVESDLWKRILQNIDAIPNLGEHPDTMEAWWLRETILRNLEKNGNLQSYYDSKGEEYPPTRGPKAAWKLADWAKEYLTKGMPGKYNRESKTKSDTSEQAETPTSDAHKEDVVHSTNTNPSNNATSNSQSYRNTAATDQQQPELTTPNQNVVSQTIKNQLDQHVIEEEKLLNKSSDTTNIPLVDTISSNNNRNEPMRGLYEGESKSSETKSEIAETEPFATTSTKNVDSYDKSKTIDVKDRGMGGLAEQYNSLDQETLAITLAAVQTDVNKLVLNDGGDSVNTIENKIELPPHNDAIHESQSKYERYNKQKLSRHFVKFLEYGTKGSEEIADTKEYNDQQNSIEDIENATKEIDYSKSLKVEPTYLQTSQTPSNYGHKKLKLPAEPSYLNNNELLEGQHGELMGDIREEQAVVEVNGQMSIDQSKSKESTDTVSAQQDSTSSLEKAKSYIEEIWKKHQKEYEHLGKDNPFADGPPDPAYLLQKFGKKEKYDSASREEYQKHQHTDSKSGPSSEQEINVSNKQLEKNEPVFKQNVTMKIEETEINSSQTISPNNQTAPKQTQNVKPVYQNSGSTQAKPIVVTKPSVKKPLNTITSNSDTPYTDSNNGTRSNAINTTTERSNPSTSKQLKSPPHRSLKSETFSKSATTEDKSKQDQLHTPIENVPKLALHEYITTDENFRPVLRQFLTGPEEHSTTHSKPHHMSQTTAGHYGPKPTVNSTYQNKTSNTPQGTPNTNPNGNALAPTRSYYPNHQPRKGQHFENNEPYNAQFSKPFNYNDPYWVPRQRLDQYNPFPYVYPWPINPYGQPNPPPQYHQGYDQMEYLPHNYYGYNKVPRNEFLPPPYGVLKAPYRYRNNYYRQQAPPSEYPTEPMSPPQSDYDPPPYIPRWKPHRYRRSNYGQTNEYAAPYGNFRVPTEPFYPQPTEPPMGEFNVPSYGEFKTRSGEYDQMPISQPRAPNGHISPPCGQQRGQGGVYSPDTQGPIQTPTRTQDAAFSGQGNGYGPSTASSQSRQDSVNSFGQSGNQRQNQSKKYRPHWGHESNFNWSRTTPRGNNPNPYSQRGQYGANPGELEVPPQRLENPGYPDQMPPSTRQFEQQRTFHDPRSLYNQPNVFGNQYPKSSPNENDAFFQQPNEE